MRRSFVAFLLLVACSKQDVPVADAGPAASPASSSPASPLAYRVSVVAMNGKTVEECTDLAVNIVPPPSAPPGWKPKDDVVAGLLKVMKDAKRIEKPCAEQFAERPALATCETSAKSKRTDGSEGQLQISAHYYDFAKIGLSDMYMTLCASKQGKWKPIPRDSAEWQKAKADHAQQQKDAGP